MELARPVMGGVSAPFGYSSAYFGGTRKHSGVDFYWLNANPTASRKVYSAHPGTVVDAGYSSAPGNYVLVDIGNGYKLRYIHLSSIAVKVGQRVDYSTFLGVMGDTGTATAPGQIHLHLDLYKGTTRIDPMPYMTLPFGHTGITQAGTETTPIEPDKPTDTDEEDDMKPKVFERTGSATREAMVVAPWVVGATAAEKGYRVLLSDADILAAERMYARGSGTADKVDRDGYIAVQVQARKDHAAWGSFNVSASAPVDVAPLAAAIEALPEKIRTTIFK